MDLEKKSWEQANELTRAIKGMNDSELDVLFDIFAIRQVGETTLDMELSDFMKWKGVQGGNQDKLFKQACFGLMRKSQIHIPKHLSRTGNDVLTSIIPKVEFNIENDFLRFHIDSDVLPLLDELKGNKTWFYIDQMRKLKGAYSKLIYQFCKTKLGVSESVKYRWYINPSETNKEESFRTWLGIEKVYKDRFNNLRAKIIEPAFKEISESNIDITVDYKIYYRGRSAFALDLIIETKEKKAKPQITDTPTKVPNQIKPKRGRIVEKMPVYSEPDPNKVVEVDLDELQALVKKLEGKRESVEPPLNDFFDFSDFDAEPSVEPPEGQTSIDDFIKE